MEIAFSDALHNFSFRTLKEHAIPVTGGETVKASRTVPRQSQRWRIRVKPAGEGEVTLTVNPIPNAARTTTSARVPGPLAISVADASATEGVDTATVFTVTLDRFPLTALTVAYKTEDGSAAADEDDTAVSGMLTFSGIQTSSGCRCRCSTTGSTRATRRQAGAVGALARVPEGRHGDQHDQHDDALQRAWVARFGRTVAGAAVDAIAERLAGGGTRVTVGGQELPLGGVEVGNRGQSQVRNLQAWLMDTVIGRYIDPQIVPDYDEFVLDERQIVTVPAGSAKPYAVRRSGPDDYCLRLGDTVQRAGASRRRGCFSRAAWSRFERMPVHGSSLAHLDMRRLEEYFLAVLG